MRSMVSALEMITPVEVVSLAVPVPSAVPAGIRYAIAVGAT